jgi:methylamine---glutamate N-methyltransferase subunit A
MCGLVGLQIRNPDLQPRLGALLTTMLEAMTTRGPDSAGIAVYADPDSEALGYPEALGYSVRADPAPDWAQAAARIAELAGAPVSAEVMAAAAAVLRCAAPAKRFRAALNDVLPGATVTGSGRSMVLVKDVGAPAAICASYKIQERGGYQGVGHTRMATESAVTTAHSHPFAPAPDLALVHNGSFSNYATVRARLTRAGAVFDTDNDSEVAARLIAARMAAGDDLEAALKVVLTELDGFFTLLVTTRDQFAVVRDSFACKPAVIAQTPDYVAMASEYHALTGLPGIGDAEVFEPMPEEIHLWNR